ncbi:hypothetical protein H1235_00410 [Pseudoxanthomonas sp. NC8]|nr:hypothetical protein H1235_00410 [Pseudoxanthomonas sp. NC8]
MAGIPGVPGLSLPGISADTAGNAAGVLQYCVKRKYLGGDAVASVGNRLLANGACRHRPRRRRTPVTSAASRASCRAATASRSPSTRCPTRSRTRPATLVLKNASSLV